MAVGAILKSSIEELSGIFFDIVSERRTARTRKVTKHPVEAGYQISDSIIEDSLVISLKAEIGNIDVLQQVGLFEKAATAYDSLLAIYESKELIEYQTGFELFENMVITSWEIVEEPPTSGALMLDLTMEQIEIALTEQVRIPRAILEPGKLEKQMVSETNRGRQDPVLQENKKVLNVPTYEEIAP